MVPKVRCSLCNITPYLTTFCKFIGGLLIHKTLILNYLKACVSYACDNEGVIAVFTKRREQLKNLWFRDLATEFRIGKRVQKL